MMIATDRRGFIQGMAAGAILLASKASTLSAATTHTMPPAEATPDFKPDLEFDLTASLDEIGILPGAATRVWRFSGRVVRAAPGAFSIVDGSKHIPVIRARRGQRVRVNFANRLPEDTIVHWHGVHIVQRMDGHPMYAIGPGKRYVYEFVVDNRAGTYWFHPHPTRVPASRSIRDWLGCFL